jgi:hypothetical protein
MKSPCPSRTGLCERPVIPGMRVKKGTVNGRYVITLVITVPAIIRMLRGVFQGADYSIAAYHKALQFIPGRKPPVLITIQF